MSSNRKILLSLIIVFFLDLSLPYIPIQNKLYLACGLSLVQIIIIPFFATRFLIPDFKLLLHSKSQKIMGVFIGAIFGGIMPSAPAIITMLINIVFPKIASNNNFGQFFKFEGLSTQSGSLFLFVLLNSTFLIIIGAFIGLISSLTLGSSLENK